jgi:CTD kinase subunit gamma
MAPPVTLSIRELEALRFGHQQQQQQASSSRRHSSGLSVVPPAVPRLRASDDLLERSISPFTLDSPRSIPQIRLSPATPTSVSSSSTLLSPSSSFRRPEPGSPTDFLSPHVEPPRRSRFCAIRPYPDPLKWFDKPVNPKHVRRRQRRSVSTSLKVHPVLANLHTYVKKKRLFTTACAVGPDMADPFEVRMRFTSSLQHLNASINAAQKCAAYALRYRDMDEDLHSCILETLERSSLNNRANVFYFFETLCDSATQAHHVEFVRMMERDILRIVDLVAPEDGSGAANVKVVRKVLGNLAAKKYLQQQTVDEIEECIKDRDQIGGLAANGIASPDSTTPLPATATTSTTNARGHANNNNNNNSSTTTSTANVRVDKRQIEQRIEEDRERHKRLREGIWAVNHAIPAEDEFERMWAETSELNDDDYRMAAEEAAERNEYARLHRNEWLGQ